LNDLLAEEGGGFHPSPGNPTGILQENEKSFIFDRGPHPDGGTEPLPETQ